MIYYPKVFGTCSGSNNAINIAIKLKDEFNNKNIYIYKELLHNEYVLNYLNKKEIKTIDDLNELKKDDILIIRAHGEGKSTYDYLNKKGITYYDATCINVRKVHELVKNKYNEGFKIIIVGKKNHPEVIGTNGWVNNEAILIEDENDYKLLNPILKYYVVSQTTTSYDNVDKLIKYLLKNKFNFESDNTICSHQKSIQLSSVNLAKDMDMMIVIGGKNSSNTKELFNECSKVCKSFYFSNIDDFYSFIQKSKITSKTKIGFTGGASTLKDEIFEYAHLLEFILYYKETKKKIEKEIIKYNKSINKTNNKIIDSALDKFINQNNNGKCIRGTLIDLGYKLNNNDNKSIYLSAAYEAFETSILIHDDIIDNSPLRRGKKTIHEEYKDEFKDYKIDTTPSSLALCLGDYGFFNTNKYLLEKYKNNKNLYKVLHYYNEIVLNTINGEILDVYLPYIEKNDKTHILNELDIFEIYRLKTSIYTIVGPFILGMLLGNSKEKDIKMFEELLEPIGIAFQIKDDILGIFSEQNTIGKSNTSDIEEFKQTLLYSYIKIYKKEYLDKLLTYYGNKTNINDLKEVQNILIESGSLDYSNNKMNELFELSKLKLKTLNIDLTIKNILLGLITFLELRKK